MAGQSIAQATIDIAANVAKLRSDLAQGQREFKSFAGGIQTAGRQIRTALGALGLGVGLNEIKNFIVNGIQAADAIGELAAQAGIGTTALQALQFAAKQNGASAEELESGIARLTRNIADAADGSKQARGDFDRLGVSWQDVNGQARTTEAVLADVVAQLLGARTATERAAIASTAFGDKVGQKLVPALTSSADGLAGLIKRAEDLGVVLDEKTIQQASAAADAMDLLELRAGVLGDTLAVKLAPALMLVTGALTELLNFDPAKFENLQKLAEIGALIAGSTQALQPGHVLGPTSGADFGAAVGAGVVGVGSTTPAGAINPFGGASGAGGGGTRPRGGGSAGTPLTELAISPAMFALAREGMEEYRQRADEATDTIVRLKQAEDARNLEALIDQNREAAASMQELVGAATDLGAEIASAAAGFESWKDVGKAAIQAVFGLLESELKKMEFMGGKGNSIFDMLFGGGGSGGGGGILSLITGLFSGGGGGTFPGIPSGFAMAGGGSGIVDRPTLFLAGEAGREAFSFAPLSRGGGAGDGGVTVRNHFDFRGAMVDTAKIRYEIEKATPAIVDRSVAATSATMRRGGHVRDSAD